MFLWGFLCGGVPWLTLWAWERRHNGRRQPLHRRQAAVWQKTRNFLYYDGTEMPVIKEKAAK